MAAAVMRAMTFGALSGGGSDDSSSRGRSSRGGGGDTTSEDGGGGGSRSSSKNRFSKSLSRESTIELDDERVGLSKSLSRLSVSSGGNLPPGGGILINSSRSRPSSPQPPYSRSYERGGGDLTPLGAASTSQLDLSNSSPQPTSIMTGHRPSLSISLSEPSTSLSPRRPSGPDRTHSSTSSINEPLTPSSSSAGFIIRPAQNGIEEELLSGTSPTTGEQRKPKIKFAPLPQIRPRSYSTGRNVWPEYDEDGSFLESGEFALGEDEDGEGVVVGDNGMGGRHLVRREDGSQYRYSRDVDFDEDDNYDQDEEDAKFTRRQSWTDTALGSMSGVWGIANKKDRREVEEDAISLGSSGGGGGSDYGLSSSKERDKEGGVSKILKPFLFGRKKSINKHGSSSSNKVPSSVEGEASTGSLSRQSSVESEYSRKSIDSPGGATTPTNGRPKGTTGIPMRKASTWDSTNSAGSGGTSKPSKPQNKNRFSTSSVASTSLPRDPSTPQIIYYASPNRATRAPRRAQYPPVAQRSRTAPKTIQKSKVEEPEFSEWGSVGSVGSVGSRGKSTADEDEDGSGMAWIRRRRKEREEKERLEKELAASQPRTATPPPSTPQAEEEYKEDEKENNEVVSRAIGRNPKRQSTMDSTFSSTSTIRPASPKIMSGLSLSRPPQAEIDESQVSKDLSEEPEEESESESEEEEDQEAEEESESEDEDEEEEVEEGEKEGESDEDDLDEEELAQEEALADAARRTAKGAGAERYHSTNHENKLHVPVDTVKRQSSQIMKRSNSNGSTLD